MFMFLGFIPRNFLGKQTHKKTEKIQLKNEIINLKALIFNPSKFIKSPSHKPRKFKTRKSLNPRSHNPHFFNHQTHIETQNPTRTTLSPQNLEPSNPEPSNYFSNFVLLHTISATTGFTSTRFSTVMSVLYTAAISSRSEAILSGSEAISLGSRWWVLGSTGFVGIWPFSSALISDRWWVWLGLIRSRFRERDGFSTSLTQSEADTISKNPLVLAVFEDRHRELHTTRSPQFLCLKNQRGLWSDFDYGSDVIIGLLDTEIWLERHSFFDRNLEACWWVIVLTGFVGWDCRVCCCC